MSAYEPKPHATGYEDAITRRIAGLEGRIAELEAELARERAQATRVVEDNARLRTRDAAAEQALQAARRTRTLGWVLIVIALVVTAVVAFWRLAPRP